MSYVLHSKGRYTAHSLVDFGGRYIYPDGHDDSQYTQLCSKQIDATVKSFFVKMTMIFLSFGAGVTGPAYALLFYNIKTTTIEVKLPFVDEKSDAEYLGNMLLQGMIAGHGIIGYIGIEVAMVLFSDVVTISSKIVEHELWTLSEDIEKEKLNKQLSLRFRNIVRQALDADECVSILKSIDGDRKCAIHLERMNPNLGQKSKAIAVTVEYSLFNLLQEFDSFFCLSLAMQPN